MEKYELIKKIYILCVYYRWDIDRIHKIVKDDFIIKEAKEFGRKWFKNIDIDIDIDVFINGNLFEYLKSNDKELYNKYEDGYFYIYNQILNNDRYKSILLMYMNCVNFNIAYFRCKDKINSFVSLYYKDRNDEVKDKLTERFNKFDKFLLDNRNSVDGYFTEKNKKEKLDTSIRVINYFINLNINGSCSIEDFCNLKYISLDRFNDMVESIRKKEVELYRKFCLVKVALNENIDSSYLFKFGDLYKYIEYGINEKGEYGSSRYNNLGYRQFDILDYFLMFKVNPTKFKNFSKFIDNCKKNIYISKFFDKCFRLYNLLDYESALNCNLEVNCLNDSEGLPIKGSGTSIDFESKEKVLEFLKENDIPFYSNIILLAYTKYINGQLQIDNKKTMKK